MLPGAQGWKVVRHGENNDAWDVRGAATLDEVAPMLNGTRDLVLGLPVNAVLAQRLRLPTAEPAEFAEMVRIQIEKALPYSAEEVTTDFEVIEQTAEGSVVCAVAVHNQKLSELAAPLLSRGIIPRQVTVYAAQRAATHAAAGRAFLIYPENDTLVCAISEEGKVGFTRSLEDADANRLERDLPQLALSAEMQGINTSFPVVLLDESLFGLRETVQGLFASRADLIAVEAPPATTKLNLLPESWRQRRADLVRLAEWKRRIIWAGAAYGALFLLFFIFLTILRLEVGRLDSRIARDEPDISFVKKTETQWKALAPAIDPHFYPIEVLLHLFESLPSADVRITAFNQSARQVQVDGEANSAALAYQFADAVKKNAELKTFQFEMAAPRILTNNHAQFRLEGKPK
ncbi:MAG: pilus assembly protein PilM [Chthoniobacterales bacterium]|nr:pilus assembly protein PilM [Chthoniobacterales bacterium]